MRQSRLLLLLLLLLVCAGAAVAWLIAQGPGHDATGGAPLSDLPVNLDGAAPLSGCATPPDGESATNRETTPRTQPERPKTQPRPERPLKPDGAELGPEEWLIKGRIQFAEGLPLDTASTFAGGWHEVTINFLADGADGEVAGCAPAIEPDGRFREVFDAADLPFPLRDGNLPPGRWQVVCNLDGEVRNMWDLGEELTIEQLPGLVQPVISGRVIDFGDVTLGHAALFGETWLVTGRVVHSSGRAVANFDSIMLAVFSDGGRVAECYFKTDQQGRFTATLWDDEVLSAPPAQWDARLFNSDDGFWDSEGSSPHHIVVALPKPQVRGRVIDYGEIKVGGSLLEVEAEMEGIQPELLPDGRLQQSFWTEYAGRAAGLNVHDGYHDLDATVYPSPAKTTIWLPEGRYEYGGYLDGDGDYYPLVEGFVSVPDGQVVPLKLHFKRHRVIPLELHTSEGVDVSRATVIWQAVRGEDEFVCYEYLSGSPPFTVPVFPGLTTKVQVEADGFAPVEGSVTESDEKLVLKLEAVAAGVATLRIQVPELPEAIADLPEALLVVVRLDNGGTVYGVYAGSGEHVVPVPAAGAYKVTLAGGGNWGYPGGVLSGPVEVTVKVGDDVPVTLPAIGLPPWPFEAGGYVSNVRCAGRPISLDTDVLIGEGNGTVRASMSTGQEFSLSAPPVAIPDGDQRIPLEVPAPSEEGEQLAVSLELEARIEVRVTRQGKPVTSFQATADGADGFSASAGAMEGTVLLWAPPGATAVTMNLLGRSFTRRSVEVSRGTLARVDFTLDSVRVEFDLAGDDEDYYVDSSNDLPPPWRVYLLSDDTEQEMHDLWGDEAVLMNPGRYRIVPGYGDPGLAFELDISDGKDRVVNLPELPRLKLYSVRLKFDTSAFGDKWFDADISTCPASRLVKAAPYSSFSWTQTRAVPDGIELLDVPAGAELVVIGSIWLERGENEETWLLKPFRLKISGEGEVVNCTWVRGVPKGEAWWELQAYDVSLLPGLLFPLHNLDTLFPGRHELVFAGAGGVEVVREWIEVPADAESFDIPATLRATLEAKELLTPEQPNEMPLDEE
jgi:hypothetical protein